jgi:serine/threonine-protein kinase
MSSIDNFDAGALLGQQVGTCTILQELARGGMGIVYIAYQRTLKRQIAIKILPKNILKKRAAERFQQEAESAAILSHPNIVPVYEVGETEEFFFFTMQLVRGKDLGDVMDDSQKHILPSKRFLPLPFIMKTVCQVLNALDYAHEEEIVHRDMKPENVLIERRTERPLISDFGVAKVLRGEDLDAEVRGTPVYMAPEQINRSPVDGRADIYAVGIMLFEMMVPELPLPQTDSAMALIRRKVELKDNFFQKPPSALNPAINQEMGAIIEKATAHDPEQRYERCSEFAHALQEYERKFIK